MDSFKNQVWLAFQSLMNGDSLIKNRTTQPHNIMAIPKQGNEPSWDWTEKEINVLLREGIVVETDELPEAYSDREKSYILTEKGQKLADEFRGEPIDTAIPDFLSRITITSEDWRLIEF